VLISHSACLVNTPSLEQLTGFGFAPGSPSDEVRIRECKASMSFLTSDMVWSQSSGFGFAVGSGGVTALGGVTAFRLGIAAVVDAMAGARNTLL
jgi:hypothetical protein